MRLTKLYYCEDCNRWMGTEKVCKCGAVTIAKDVPLRRAGSYFVDGVDRALTSVTHVLGVIAKPQLDTWKQKQVAEAIYKDPTISLEEALRAPNKPRDAAGSKGTDVHRIIETVGQKLKIEDYQDPWRKHLEAYLDFCKQFPHKVVAKEQTVYSVKHGYAGTLDAIIELQDGKRYLIDYKTNKSVYPKDFAPQVGAYFLALQEMGQKIDGCAILHLKADGTYNWLPVTPEPRVFLAALLIYNYQNS